MARGINATTIAALQTDAFNLCHLIQIDFGTVVRLTDWGRSISALSNTFISSAHILEIGQTSESSDPRINSMNIIFSGADRDVIAVFLANNYMDVRTRVYLAVLGSADAVVGDPFLVFDGRISSFTIEDSGSDSTITVEVSSHWRDFELRKGRRTNRNSQQLYFSGDKGMDFAGTVVKDLKWGRQ